MQQRVEAAQGTLVPQLYIRDILGERALCACFSQDLIGWHVEEFWLGIDKTADEPGTGNAIDFGPFTCNPFHRLFLLDKEVQKM